MDKLLAVALLALAACNNPPLAPAPGAADKPPIQLQVYDVPAGTVREMRSALNGVLGNKENSETALGRVSVTPDGRLMVLAPERIQAGVKSMVEQIAKKAGVAPARVETTFWIVVGKRDGKGELPPGLVEIKAALDEVAKTQGPMQFRLLELLKLATLSGETGSVRGESGVVKQEMTATNGSVLARFALNAGPKSVDTSVQMKPGQTLVLAQTGWKEKEGDEEATLLFVVRADVRDASPASP